MQKAICIGEAMVELAPDGAGGWRLGYAGDTLNMAWYLRARLGTDWQVGYCSRLGGDAFSARLRDFVAGAGIDISAIGTDPNRSVGLYAISLEHGERSFTYWRSDSAARRLADDPGALQDALQGAALACFSGITLAILPEAGRAALLDALAAARRAGCRIAFDPNIRPRLWQDPEVMRHTITEAARISDILLPSFDDESQWFGDTDTSATRRRYAALGVTEVVVKNGAAPPCIWQAGGQEAHPALPPVQPLDTTGAGDAFNGGYIAARLNGAAPGAAALLAHALAARVVRHPGALLPQAEAAQC